MNETELERIVVRLVGDGSSYQKMLLNAVTQTQSVAKQVEQAARRIEGIKNNVLGFGQSVVGALGAFGIATSLQGAFQGFSDLERGQIRLKSSIEASGQALEPTLAKFKAFADEIARTTLLTKGEVLGLLQRATVMGLNEEASERAARVAISLAGATGQGAEEMLRYATAIERGNLQMLRRLPMFRGLTDQSQILEKLNQAVTGGMRTQIEIANTASGRIEKLGRSLKFLGTELGGIIATAIQPFVAILSNAAEYVKNLDDATKKAAAKILGLALAFLALGPAVRILRSFVAPITGIIASIFSMTIAMGIFIVKQTISIGLWVVQKSLALAAIGVYTVFAAAIVAIGVATTGWAAAQALVTAALSPLALIQAVLAVTALGGLVLWIGPLVAGLAVSLGAVYGILRNLPGTFGPIETIKGLFVEWLDILKDVVQLLQADVPAAIEYMKGAWEVAVAEFRLVWPPLWQFIQDGFSDLMTSINDMIATESHRARSQWARDWIPLVDYIASAMGRTQEMVNNEAAAAQQEHLTTLRNNLLVASQDFQTAMAEQNTAEVEAARTRLEGIRDGLYAGLAAAQQAAGRAGGRIGAAVTKPVKEAMLQVQAAARYSVEALTRIADYEYNFRKKTGHAAVGGGHEDHEDGMEVAFNGNAPLAGGGPAVSVAAAVSAGTGMRQLVALTRQVVTNTGRNQTVQMEPAGLT